MRFLQFLAAVGFKPTPAQRTLCRVAFDEGAARGEEELALAVELFGVADLGAVPAGARGVVAVVKGARVGGSRLAATYLAWRCLTAPLDTLARAERASALVVAPDRRLARQSLRFARGAIASLPDVDEAVESDGADGFILRRPDGARVAIECLPATRGGSAVRGRSLVGAVLSEVAFFRDKDSGVVNDVDVYRAISPRIMPGGKIVLESTPWLQSGLLYELDRDNFAVPEGALVAHAPTMLMRPSLAGIVERERRRDPDNAAVEFDGQFLGGGAGVFFDDDSLRRAVDVDRPQVSRVAPSVAVGAGADLGLVSDSSALAIVASEGGVLSLLELVEQRPAKGSPLKLSAVVGDFAKAMHGHGVTSALADAWAREPAREYATAAKIAIEAAPEGQAGKWETYDALRQAMREGRVRLPDHPRLIAQLRAIVAQAQPGGGYAIRSPRRAGGGHGDLVSALVLAAWAAREAEAGHTTGPRSRAIPYVFGVPNAALDDMEGGS